MASRDVAAHLGACCASIYEAFGEGAPTLSDDAFVVRAHELSRVFGERALELSALAGEGEVAPLPIISSVLGEALERDRTGAMALFAFVSLVGPRLLISVRDAHTALDGDAELGVRIDEVANTLVREIRRTAEVVRELPAGDQEWLGAARGLTTQLDESGNGESFGLFA